MRNAYQNVVDQRHALDAALLSLVPGLGQLYLGDRRKGILFLDVAAVNAILLLTMLYADSLAKAASQFGSQWHMTVNSVLVDCMHSLHPGSPVFLSVSAFAVLFTFYAVRDSYDKALVQKRKRIYPATVLELSEAASGSYLMHFAMLATAAIAAMFFLVPPKPAVQSVQIFVLTNPNDVRKKVDTNKLSTHNSEAHGQKTQSVSQPTSSKSAQGAKYTTAPQHNVVQRLVETPRPVVQPVAPKSIAAPPPSLPTPKLMSQALSAMPLASAVSSSRSLCRTAPPTPTIGSSGLPTIATLPGPAPWRSNLAGVGSEIAQPTIKPGTGTQTGAYSAPAPVSGRSTSIAGNDGTAPPVMTTGGNGTSTRESGGILPQRATEGTGGRESGPRLVVGPVGAPRMQTAQPSGDGKDRQPDSGESRAAEFGPYMAALQRRIKSHWYPSKRDLSKQVVVMFRISTEGAVSNLRIHKSSGDAAYDNAALEAVQNSSPFPHLPQYAPESVDIEFTFDYNVFRGNGGMAR